MAFHGAYNYNNINYLSHLNHKEGVQGGWFKWPKKNKIIIIYF